MKHFGIEAVSNIIITIGRSNSYSHPLVVVNYKLREVELVDGNAAVEVLQARDVLHLAFHSRRTECGEVPHQYLSHINTCHTWREMPHQYLSHINTCHISIPVSHQHLSHINACHTWRSATSIPVTHQYLSHINTCHTWREMPHQYLSHIDTCHISIPVSHQHLSHINACHTWRSATSIPVTHQHLSHINTCHTWRSATSTPVTHQYLSHMEKCHINTCKRYVFIYYSAVSSPLDRSKHFTLHSLADLFIPTPTQLLWEAF